MREATDAQRKPLRKTDSGFVWHGMVNCGFFYRDANGPKEFEDPVTHKITRCSQFKRSDGSRYCGLLDLEGYPLKIGEPVIVLWFKIRDASPKSASRA